MKQIKFFDHLNMTVRNLDESLDWYARVFGFEWVESGERKGVRWAIVRSGEAMLCLYEHPNRTYECAYDGPLHGIRHFAIRIGDKDEWEGVIEREQIQVQFDSAVDYPHSTSWYVVDPTGYQIEVVHWNADEIRFAA
jgi:lactoylglutathione lyase